MIGKIKGTLAEVDGNIGLIETASGVFYQVFLTNSLLTLVFPGNPIEIYTYHQVREDAQLLFGFQNKQEYKLFTLVIGVPGVGPKTAFGIISHTKVGDFVSAIKANDSAYFTRIPGLGKKTALKIILELAQKFESEFILEQTYHTEEERVVIDALISLGFKSNDAKDVLAKMDKAKSTEEKITEGIRILSRK